jgi:hypothetical protein
VCESPHLNITLHYHTYLNIHILSYPYYIILLLPYISPYTLLIIPCTIHTIISLSLLVVCEDPQRADSPFISMGYMVCNPVRTSAYDSRVTAHLTTRSRIVKQTIAEWFRMVSVKSLDLKQWHGTCIV